jgi:hypothetical protein
MELNTCLKNLIKKNKNEQNNLLKAFAQCMLPESL